MKKNVIANWLAMYEQARAHSSAEGNLYLTEGNLGQWLTEQRSAYKAGTLSELQAAMLDAIGMEWNGTKNAHAASWETKFRALRDYSKEHGGSLAEVTLSFTKDGLNLGTWVGNQRSLYKRGKLSNDRIQRLEAIGIVWSTPASVVTKKNDDFFMTNYAKVKALYEQFGSINVKSNFVTEDGFRMGAWLYRMRRLYAEGHLSAERVRLLEELGIIWGSQKDVTAAIVSEETAASDVQETSEASEASEPVKKAAPVSKKHTSRFDEMYAEAMLYFKEHGNLDVAEDFVTPTGAKLGRWICNARKQKASGYLSADYIDRLNAIGMVWDTTKQISAAAPASKDRFETMYAGAKDLYEKTGNINRKSTFVNGDGVKLGHWLYEMRRAQAAGKLSKEREKRLEEIGIEWGSQKEITAKFQSADWDEMYRLAKQYVTSHKNLLMPSVFYMDGLNVGGWLCEQRNLERNNQLPAHHKALLNELGMVWNFRADAALLESNITVGDGIDIDLSKISCTDEDPDWDAAYAACKEYLEENGNIDIPVGFRTQAGFDLGAWLEEKRKLYHELKLSGKQTMMLEFIQMDWSERQVKDWGTYYPVAKRYYDDNRSWNDLSYDTQSEGLPLGEWTSRQRQLNYVRGLTKPKRKAMADMKFKWMPQTHFENTLRILEEYKAEHGTINVPQKTVWKEFRIGSWIASRRAQKKAGKLSDERIEALEALGIDWEPSKTKSQRYAARVDAAKQAAPADKCTTWAEAMKVLEIMKKEEGTINVPCSAVRGSFKVGRWLSKQRYLNRKGLLPAGRISQLDALGMNWNPSGKGC